MDSYLYKSFVWWYYHMNSQDLFKLSKCFWLEKESALLQDFLYFFYDFDSWRLVPMIFTVVEIEVTKSHANSGPLLRFWKFRREIIFLLIKFLKFHKIFFLPNMFLKKFQRHCAGCAGANEGPVQTKAIHVPRLLFKLA